MISEEKAKENMQRYKEIWKQLVEKAREKDDDLNLWLDAREAMGLYEAYKEVLEIKDKEGD